MSVSCRLLVMRKKFFISLLYTLLDSGKILIILVTETVADNIMRIRKPVTLARFTVQGDYTHK